MATTTDHPISDTWIGYTVRGVASLKRVRRLLAMIEAEQADGWTDFRIVGHLMGYLAEQAAISDDAA